jgi:hypothetical protein
VKEVIAEWRKVHIKESEMDRACRRHGRDEKSIQNFSLKI